MSMILIADDDNEVRTFLKDMLERAGYSVIEAKNGAEVIRIYRQKQKKVALVIVDIVMPEQDGIGTITELTNLDPLVKIIAISGGGQFVNLDILRVAKQLGAKHTFAKPFDRKEMLMAVKELTAS